MRDYLEELLDRLTHEDEEEAAGVWETQAVSLILPKALELPEGTVRWRYSAARKKLKASLEREDAAQAAAKRI